VDAISDFYEVSELSARKKVKVSARKVPAGDTPFLLPDTLNYFKKIALLLLLAALHCLCLPGARANEAQGSYNQTLLESQQKYLVPAGLADSLWHYLQRRYQTRSLKKINPNYSAQALVETYLDEYYDDAAYTLLRHQHGLRLRRVFSGKAVDRQFIQLKISKRPRLRELRREIKFNINDQPDKHGGDPGHPFLRLVRAADRRQLEAALRALQVQSRELRPVLTLLQQRRRLYLRDRGNELAIISLDAVTTEDGQTSFYELELALDEPTYTGADVRQRQRLSQVTELLQLDLAARFPQLRQDPHPKYNKMYDLLHQGRIRPRLYTLAWLGVALVLGAVLFYLWRTRNQPLPQPREMF
jgi:hypothetical protein